MIRLLTILLLLTQLLTPALSYAATDATAEQRLEKALKVAERGYYTKAMELLQALRNTERGSQVALQAELAIADLYFERGEYEEAYLIYRDFSRLHPTHARSDYVILRMGQSVFKRASRRAGRDQSSTEQALSLLREFERRYPDSKHKELATTLVEEARDRLARRELIIARFYEKRAAWGAAGRRAEHLLTTYPGSEHVPAALAIKGKTLHNWGATEEATATMAQLEQLAPGSKALRRLQRALQEPAGHPPEETATFRPYRAAGINTAPSPTSR